MTTADSSPRIRLVNPKGTELPTTAFRMNDRSGGLSGQASWPDGEFPRLIPTSCCMELGNILNERHGFSEVRYYAKHHASLPAKQDVIDSVLGEVDYLITGVGD